MDVKLMFKKKAKITAFDKVATAEDPETQQTAEEAKPAAVLEATELVKEVIVEKKTWGAETIPEPVAEVPAQVPEKAVWRPKTTTSVTKKDELPTLQEALKKASPAVKPTPTAAATSSTAQKAADQESAEKVAAEKAERKKRLAEEFAKEAEQQKAPVVNTGGVSSVNYETLTNKYLNRVKIGREKMRVY
jgi:hypothetical protein